MRKHDDKARSKIADFAFATSQTDLSNTLIALCMLGMLARIRFTCENPPGEHRAARFFRARRQRKCGSFTSTV
eukprot:96944-Rhodomonas_salina.1